MPGDGPLMRHKKEEAELARIVMLVWNDFRTDARVLKEAETLQAAGHGVHVLAIRSRHVAASETLASGVVVTRVSVGPLAGTAARGGRLMKVAGRVWSHVAMTARTLRLRPDVIHAHDVNMLPTAWLASRMARSRIIYDAHEISTGREGYDGFRGLVHWIEKRLTPRVDGMITTTGMRAKFFARAYGVARPLVLENRPRFVPARASRRIADELALPPERPIVLYQGVMQEGRGLARIVDAAAEIGGATFVFIGGGRLAGPLHERVEALGIGERVRFIETVDLPRLPDYTASASIGVQALENTCLNHYTTDSNKLFEYVMGGLPVVASDLPEIGRIVRAHDCGLLVPPGDTAALASAIRRLVDDADLRERLAENARRAARVLTWESQEGRLLALYETVLSRPRGSRA